MVEVEVGGFELVFVCEFFCEGVDIYYEVVVLEEFVGDREYGEGGV